MKINLIYVKAESRSNMFKHSKASEYLDFQVKNKKVLKMLTYVKDGLTQLQTKEWSKMFRKSFQIIK